MYLHGIKFNNSFVCGPLRSANFSKKMIIYFPKIFLPIESDFLLVLPKEDHF